MATKANKCLCGGKAEMFVGPYGAFYRCKKCGKKSTASWDSERAAQHWNKENQTKK